MKEKQQEKRCATCRHAAAPMMKDPCRSCLIQTRKGDEYPGWQPQEDPE